MDKQTQTEVEAAVFRRLVEHLDANKDVQNIDLMILARDLGLEPGSLAVAVIKATNVIVEVAGDRR